MDKIEKVRQDIDIIDEKIMKLLDERFEKTTLIGTIKKESNTTVLDQNRELIILNKTSNYKHFPEIESIYKTIMCESKKLQRKK